MIQLRKSTAAAIVGLGALAFAATAVLANGTDVGAGPMRLAHMDSARGNARAGSMDMMGSGMMGDHMGVGMMGDHMGVGMMGPDDKTGSCPGVEASADKALDTGDVRASLERNLVHHGNKRLKVGTVEETDDDTIVAEIVTVDGSLVQRLAVDRATGRMRHID